jgi:hypothetical protein
MLHSHNTTLDVTTSYIYICGYAFVLEMVSVPYKLFPWFWSILKFFQVSLILPRMIIYSQDNYIHRLGGVVVSVLTT